MIIVKNTRLRLQNLAAALRQAVDIAQRSVEKDVDVLDPKIVGRLEDIEADVGIVLAALEDGSLAKRKGYYPFRRKG